MSLSLSPQPEVVSFHVEERDLDLGIRYGSIRVRTEKIDGPLLDTPVQEFAVFAPGWIEEPDSFSLLTHTYLRAAQRRGIHAAAITYTTNERYRQADHDEALDDVVQSLPGDRLIHLLAHSRGGITAVHVAPMLIEEERLNGLTIIESVGHDRIELDLDALKKIIFGEVRSAHHNHDAESSFAARALGKTMVRHLRQHPVAARREVAELLSFTTIDDTVQLGKDERLSVMVHHGLRDGVCHGIQSVENLKNADFPADRLSLLDANHLDPLLNPRVAAAIFALPDVG